ncbi:hypothetical protein CBR_g52393 [Chara braunii]|uniref:Integrase catalytic domain-containing protein n=1 Tax=Chara braunii TaxID=69332 RepID=A0A388MA43_CHABU|nr:hypothetical protein CBR_g52393 [Chara braunii]|eukprot:GBG91438.1 hypothetical protein CBR_g52393 [Chara braunii]
MYLLTNTLLQGDFDRRGSFSHEENEILIPENQDDEFEEGEIKEAFRAEEYDGIYRELGLLLSCEMRDKDASAKAQKMRHLYVVRDDHLFIKRQVGNPKRIICGRNGHIDIIAALHDGIAGGHRGIGATCTKISELYHWDGMLTMVIKYCQSCIPCQERSAQRPGEPLHPRLEREVGAVMHLDLLFMPVGENGCNYVFDVRDNLTGFVDGRAIRTKTGPVLANCIEEYYLLYPFVKEFVMDRGSEFTCNEVRTLLAGYGVVANYTTAAHPQANAPVERGHSTIMNLLAKWTEGKPGQWPKFLRAAFFVENVTVKRTTKYESRRETARRKAQKMGQTTEGADEAVEIGELGFAATRKAIEWVDKEIKQTSIEAFQRYSLLSDELALRKDEVEQLTAQLAEERAENKAWQTRLEAKEAEWGTKLKEMAAAVERLAATKVIDWTEQSRYDIQGKGVQGLFGQEEAAEASRQEKLGKVFLGPTEVEARKEAYKGCFEFKAPTELASQQEAPTSANTPMEALNQEPQPAPVEEGEAEESLAILLDLQEGALTGAVEPPQSEAQGEEPSRLDESVAAMEVDMPPEEPQQQGTSEHEPEMGELRAQLGSWATGIDSGGPTIDQPQQEAMSQPTRAATSQTPRPRESEEAAMAEEIRKGRSLRLDTPEYQPEGELQRGESSAQEIGGRAKGPWHLPQSHEASKEEEEVPPSSGTQKKKKRFQRKSEAMCFYFLNGAHRALKCPKFLKDKAEGRVTEEDEEGKKPSQVSVRARVPSYDPAYQGVEAKVPVTGSQLRHHRPVGYGESCCGSVVVWSSCPHSQRRVAFVLRGCHDLVRTLCALHHPSGAIERWRRWPRPCTRCLPGLCWIVRCLAVGDGLRREVHLQSKQPDFAASRQLIARSTIVRRSFGRLSGVTGSVGMLRRRQKQLTSGPPISSPAKAQADAKPKRRDRSRSPAGRKVQPLKDEDRWVSLQRRRIEEEDLQNMMAEEGLAEGREDAETRQPAPDLDEPMIGEEGGDSTDDRGGAMDEDMDINEGMEADMDITTTVKGSLQEILAAGECYVCPVMLWWAEQGIKVVTKGNTEFFIYAARSLPKNPNIIRQGNALMRRCLHDRLAGSYRAHLATGQEYADRLSALNCGPKDEQTEEEWWVERVEAVREWQEWETVETARWGRRSKVGWTVVGEKMSRRFFRELGKKQGIALMTAMDAPFDLRQARQETTLGILDCVTGFYADLFTEEEEWTVEQMATTPLEHIWRHVPPGLTKEQAQPLERDITLEEVLRAIGELPRLKAPGVDRVPIEMYKAQSHFFGPLLMRAFNDALHAGHLPEGFADAFVVLIYKKGAREDVRNWRPISILNAPYKILAKVLSNRLNEVLPCIINPTQAGFVPGRQIVSNIMLARQILRHQELCDQPLAFVTIDLEKAYDRVRWEFLFQSLHRRGIGETFCNWTRLLLTAARTCMQVNGVRSGFLQLTRSVRQGCPLSPALYVIYIEALHDLLRGDEALQGLQLRPDMILKSTAFADDTGAVIPPTTQQLRRLQMDLDLFSLYSGARVNRRKSQAILPQGYVAPEGWDVPTLADGENLCFLGALIHPVGGGAQQMKGLAAAAILRLGRWAKRTHLGVFGKALVLKNSVLSTMWYAGAIHMPKRRVFRQLRAAVHRYLWAGDVEAESVIPRVAWSKLTQPRSQGGLGILDPELQMTALQLRNLLWFLVGTTGTAWKSLTAQHLALVLGMIEQMVLVALASPSLISHVKRNQIWSVALTLWKKIQLQQELPVTADDVYNQLLFDNPCICDDTGDPFPWQGKPGAFGKHWAECGVFKIGHL